MDIQSLHQTLRFKIIEVDEVSSSNTLLREWLSNHNVPEGTVILAGYQRHGKGQADTQWESEPFNNLLCSILLTPRFLDIQQQVYLNMAVCVALHETVSSFVGNAEIKWPNDIYIDKQKVSGILLENSIQSNQIQSCIVGIGLNVNQCQFLSEKATSLKLHTNTSMEVKQVLEVLLNNLQKWYSALSLKQFESISSYYHKQLSGLNQNLKFSSSGKIFMAIVKGVDEFGRLLLEQDGVIQAYQVKQVEWLW
ncbi:MAG: biotin--[acetyl-CoA-carboxylase] ligase [Bacteroidia bacterium]|jgi:BirA family biotin operon repressor/biotin-[acetyl-CoA-carboxylase] ligase|nr:biotin--[acetyl-CoA-carboxylase] ligase [Bacteroidia bacterium]